jgi:hypothetical protein
LSSSTLSLDDLDLTSILLECPVSFLFSLESDPPGKVKQFLLTFNDFDNLAF